MSVEHHKDGQAQPSGEGHILVVLCIEASETLVEPMCTTAALQQELVPYVLSHSLQNPAFLKLSKPERQAKVKMLTQKMLSGETGGAGGGDEDETGPHRFWAHLRNKYGTRRGHLLEMLRLLEPSIRANQVSVLRFESEVASPTASLLVRASTPCSPAGAAAAKAACQQFAPGTFAIEALGTWLQEAPSGSKAPPLWSRLVSECKRGSEAGFAEVRALVVCTEAQSTDTTPEALGLAAHALKDHAQVVPYISSVTFGPRSSERLAALSDLCAWAGGHSFNVTEPSALRPTADGLNAHLFNSCTRAKDFHEFRLFYAQKQALGTCFMLLPQLVSIDATMAQVSPAPPRFGNAAELLRNGADIVFDPTTPSESMLAVLSDVTLALPRRWGRSLRCWRERRELRDVVFGEPGGLGLELDEPQLTDSAGAKTRAWRLRATHPPASALKMKEESVLLSINHVRVHEHTPRSEIARRVAVRPVSLTFENPRTGGADTHSSPSSSRIKFAMATAEIVVGELREGLPPLKKETPPLSTAMQCISSAKGLTADGRRQRQAACILEAAVSWGTAAGSSQPAWVAQLPETGPLGTRLKTQHSLHAFSREPCLLYRTLLYCADVTSLVRVGLACCCWKYLVLDNLQALGPAGGPGGADMGARQRRASVVYRLWRWALRWGPGLAPRQRLGFWRWALKAQAAVPGGESAARARSSPAGAAALAGGGAVELVLEAAMKVDAGGLIRLASGMAGACPGLPLATAAVQQVLNTVRGGAAPEEALPADIVEGLLAGPLHGQQLWLLSSEALPWLVLQTRCLQVALAAHQPQLFRHFMSEGLSPELFYCRWLQGLFQGCASELEVLRLWDSFIFERSHKVFVRAGVALFGLLESKLRGDVDQLVEVLFHPERWGLDPGALFQRTLETKVTRSMLKDMMDGHIPGCSDGISQRCM